MHIVTFISDLGLSDFYVGAIKGAILRQSPQVQIVDISHNINPYDIVQASFILKNAYAEFPEGTVHLAGVNNDAEKIPQLIAISYDKHYFIAPDNGLLSLALPDFKGPVYSLKKTEDIAFPMKELFANAVAHIKSDQPFENIGTPQETLVERISLQPVISSSQIRGSVIHVDHYGNVVLNITKSLFEKVANDREFALYFKRHHPITQMSRHYTDVDVGEILCLFNASDNLEIAIHMGRASEMLGLKVDDTVQVDFLSSEP